jgi:hypothetical protein
MARTFRSPRRFRAAQGVVSIAASSQQRPVHRTCRSKSADSDRNSSAQRGSASVESFSPLSATTAAAAPSHRTQDSETAAGRLARSAQRTLELHGLLLAQPAHALHHLQHASAFHDRVHRGGGGAVSFGRQWQGRHRHGRHGRGSLRFLRAAVRPAVPHMHSTNDARGTVTRCRSFRSTARAWVRLHHSRVSSTARGSHFARRGRSPRPAARASAALLPARASRPLAAPPRSERAHNHSMRPALGPQARTTHLSATALQHVPDRRRWPITASMNDHADAVRRVLRAEGRA